MERSLAVIDEALGTIGEQVSLPCGPSGAAVAS
jgi:hypothetical protein